MKKVNLEIKKLVKSGETQVQRDRKLNIYSLIYLSWFILF